MLVDHLGSVVINLARAVLEFFQLLGRTIFAVFRPPFRWKQVFGQIYFVGNGSLLIITVCVSFAAMVTILESSFHMKLVIQNDSLVPGFASMLILKELGAVVTALLLTSRVGAGLTAEIGTMQITEQIDALRMLGLDPVQYLVVPRFLACAVSGIMLTLFADMTCLFCSFLVSHMYLGFSSGLFLSGLRRFAGMKDLLQSCFKGFCFGSIIPFVSCYFGFRCKAGAEGVGNATTQSVVASSVCIIATDFVLSALFS